MRIMTMMTVLLALASASAAAHHASAVFDSKKVVTLEGTIARLEWVNPHVQMYLNQKDAATGTTQARRIEMESPAGLQQQGFALDTFRLGLAVELTGMPVKPGAHVMRPLEVTMPEGLRWAARVDYK